MKYALEYLKLISMHQMLTQTFGTILLPMSQDSAGLVGEGAQQKPDQSTGNDFADQISTFLALSETGGAHSADYTLEELKEAEQRRARIAELLLEELQSFFKILLNKRSN